MSETETAQSTTNGTNLSGHFMGWKFDLKGAGAIYIFVLLVLAALVVYGALQFGRTVTDALDQKGVTDITSAIKGQTTEQTKEHREILGAVQHHTVLAESQHQAIDKTMGSIKDAIEEQNYIITLSDAERRNLKLRMPPSLREKLVVGPHKPSKGD